MAQRPATSARPSPADRLRGLAIGYFLPRALYAAAELNVAQHLADAPLTAEQLADRTGTHGPSLYRILRALASVEVFSEDAEGRFHNTPMSDLLRASVPGSLRDLVLLFGDQTSWRAWEDILHTAQTGESGFEHLYGEKFFDYLTHQPETAAMFDRAMASASSSVNAGVVAAYDFAACRRMVDVAGGVGATLCAILDANPHLNGVVFDLPHVEERARSYIDRAGLAGRCEFAGGSFFERIPAGAQLYFMKHILHDWGDEECTRILRACRAAIGTDGRLLVCERVVPAGNFPSPAKLIDLHMLMTNHGGKERTEDEYRALFAATGFELQRLISTGTPWSLLEAK